MDEDATPPPKGLLTWGFVIHTLWMKIFSAPGVTGAGVLALTEQRGGAAMTDSQEHGRLTRRGLVLGAAAGLLAACGGDDEPLQEPPGQPRRRRRQKSGRTPAAGETALTQADLEQVAAELTARLDGEDLQDFLRYARPSDVGQWTLMWQGLHDVPTTDRRFYLQPADDRWTNSQGGPVTAGVRGVVSYRVEGCDAQPMAHLCDLTVFKPPGRRARVQTLGPVRDDAAAPWLLGPVTAVTAAHTVLVSRVEDAAAARRVLDDVDQGAARAMEVIAPAAGISRICVTLGWPEARERLYGGSDAELVGSAHNYRYVDPQQLAETGTRGAGETFLGSRVVIDPAATSAQGAEAVTAHEAVHALAFQWGQGAPPLYAEGLARYVEVGADEVTRAARLVGADGFRDFARRITARPGLPAFTDPTWVEVNYTCAAMTCSHVAREHGESRLLDVVRAAYDGAPDPVRRVLGTSQRALLREVADWLEAEERGDAEASSEAEETVDP